MDLLYLLRVLQDREKEHVVALGAKFDGRSVTNGRKAFIAERSKRNDRADWVRVLI